MKGKIAALVSTGQAALASNGVVPKENNLRVEVERTKDPKFGDFACNGALILAKSANLNPRALAKAWIDALPEAPWIKKVEIAGPGFMNFYLEDSAYFDAIKEALLKGAQFGQIAPEKTQRVQIEYVSANPTGPLHVGHGRGAAFGSSLANLLKASGLDVYQEYYVNDAGRQMAILALSVWLRYLNCCDEAVSFPHKAYQGDYITKIAENLHEQYGDRLQQKASDVLADLPDPTDENNGDIYLDALIARAKKLLGESLFASIQQFTLKDILQDIQSDLDEFRVHLDEWFKESRLVKGHDIDNALTTLKASGHTYERDGAIWFNSVHFGDEKDRVLVRANGQTTYFASDAAYLLNKFERGFDKIIYIFGADHHGYIKRLKACATALGLDESKLTILLVQFATLFRGDTRVQMSTRSGSFVTLRALREEIGDDAARYFYVQRKADQHMQFDLQLAKSTSNENPVYYIQYAFARIQSVFRQLKEQNLSWDEATGLQALPQLTHDAEKQLMVNIAKFPEVIEASAKALEPHQIAHYLLNLATQFHTYYNQVPFIKAEETLREGRFCLIKAVAQVIENGLTLLGVSAPSKM